MVTAEVDSTPKSPGKCPLTLSFANQYGSGRVGRGESQNGRMDAGGTPFRSRAVDQRFAYDDGYFVSTLPRDLDGNPTSFGPDGKNLFAGFG